MEEVAMAWKSFEMESAMTLAGYTPYVLTDFIQDPESWATTTGARLGVLQFMVPCLDACTLSLEGADIDGGEWKVLKSYTAATQSDTVLLDRNALQGDPLRLTNRLRWRLQTSNTEPWRTFFRIFVTLKD